MKFYLPVYWNAEYWTVKEFDTADKLKTLEYCSGQWDVWKGSTLYSGERAYKTPAGAWAYIHRDVATEYNDRIPSDELKKAIRDAWTETARKF